MRFALCLSGHLRTFRDTISALKENVLHLDCDVFIHTWDKLGTPSFKTRGDYAHRYNDTKRFRKELEEMYSPKSLVFEDGDVRSHQLIQETNDVPVREDEKQFVIGHVGHEFSMFQSVFQCNEMRKAYEKENGVKYDRIIRARPDILFTAKLEEDWFKEDGLFVPHIGTYVEDGINDQFAVGDNDSMEVYADCYHQMGSYLRNEECSVRPEAIMAHHLKKNGISWKEAPIEYDILRLDGTTLRQRHMDAIII